MISTLISAFGLTGNDFAVDVGCGTGQLTLPLGPPHPRPRQHRPRTGLAGPRPASRRRVGCHECQLGAWCRHGHPRIGRSARQPPRRGSHHRAGPALDALPQPDPCAGTAAALGRRMAVITNGTSMWPQDSAWSRALRTYSSNGWAPASPRPEHRRGQPATLPRLAVPISTGLKRMRILRARLRP